MQYVTLRFAAFGAGDSTTLRISRQELSGNGSEGEDDFGDDDEEDGGGRRGDTTVWAMSAEKLNTARPEWTAGQASVRSNSPFRLVFEGKASNGGFAIDQLVFSPGKCSSKAKLLKVGHRIKDLSFFKARPRSADPSSSKK